MAYNIYNRTRIDKELLDEVYDTGVNEEDSSVVEEELILEWDSDLSFGSFFLWETHLPAWELFNVLRMYFTEFGGLDTTLIIRLCDERKLPLEKTLNQLPYILSSYVTERDKRVKKNE